jgi:hypothetical protein
MEEKFLIPFYCFPNTFDITNLHIGSANGTHVFVVVGDWDWFLNLFISFSMDFSTHQKNRRKKPTYNTYEYRLERANTLCIGKVLSRKDDVRKANRSNGSDHRKKDDE